MNYREVLNKDQEKISPIPVPDRLSQLYTGEDFWKDAPWASVPVVPDAVYLTHVNLRSANPPPQALFQMTSPHRPGNNSAIGNIPGVGVFEGDNNFGPFDIPCMPCIKKVACSCDFDCPCKQELCANAKVDECPCKKFGCPIKYVPIN